MKGAAIPYEAMFQTASRTLRHPCPQPAIRGAPGLPFRGSQGIRVRKGHRGMALGLGSQRNGGFMR